MHEQTFFLGAKTVTTRTLGYYPYTVCLNVQDDPTTPKNESRTLTEEEKKHIEKGAIAWTSRTDLISHQQYEDNCSDSELNLNSGSRPHTDFIRLVTVNQMKIFCNSTPAGCVHLSGYNSLTLAQIAIKDTAKVKILNNLTCSKIKQVSMHEIGHAFGLGDHNSNNPSILNYRQAHRSCKPTEYDIVAINANYQSRNSRQ